MPVRTIFSMLGASLVALVLLSPTADAAGSSAFRFFAPSSFWNTPLGAGAALDPKSTQIVARLDAIVAAEETAGTGPWISSSEYGVPIYRVPMSQPSVEVRLSGQYFDPALQAAWRAVPLPANAQPAAGHDRHLVVWQPAADRMWEFWKLARTGAGWQAAWGGAMRQVSTDGGVYGSGAWPGASSLWGATASSLPLVGGLITFGDLEAGSIEHGLAIAVPGVRAGVFASPAQRTDGVSANPASLPEGAHLRLDPKLDLSRLHLPPLTLMLARAAQRYGIYVRDGGGVVSFYGQDPGSGRNPYTAPGGWFGGQDPATLLADFPWQDLQVLKMDLQPSP